MTCLTFVQQTIEKYVIKCAFFLTVCVCACQLHKYNTTITSCSVVPLKLYKQEQLKYYLISVYFVIVCHIRQDNSLSSVSRAFILAVHLFNYCLRNEVQHMTMQSSLLTILSYYKQSGSKKAKKKNHQHTHTKKVSIYTSILPTEEPYMYIDDNYGFLPQRFLAYLIW